MKINIIKIFIKFTLLLMIFTSVSVGKEKKSLKQLVLKEKEEIKIEDFNKLGDPMEIKVEELPEGIQKKLNRGCNNSFKCITNKATRTMSKSFSRSEDYNNRNPDNLIKAMAYFELFYLGQLNKNEKYLKIYRENYEKKDLLKKNPLKWILFNDAENKIRSLISTNKGRKSMREALGMTIELDPLTAIKRFWYLGELLGLGETKKNKVSDDMKKRAKLMKEYNNILAKMKTKLEDKKKKEEKQNTKN